MEVILIEQVEKLGNVGDIVSVKSGYARNFLLPQSKALRANEENKKYFESQKADILKKNEHIRNEAEKLYKSIHDKVIVVIKQASDEGKLYGSVMPRDIADSICAETKTEVKKSQITLTDAIRETGIYVAKIRLHADFIAEIKVNVAKNSEEAKQNLKVAEKEEAAALEAKAVTTSKGEAAKEDTEAKEVTAEKA